MFLTRILRQGENDLCCCTEYAVESKDGLHLYTRVSVPKGLSKCPTVWKRTPYESIPEQMPPDTCDSPEKKMKADKFIIFPPKKLLPRLIHRHHSVHGTMTRNNLAAIFYPTACVVRFPPIASTTYWVLKALLLRKKQTFSGVLTFLYGLAPLLKIPRFIFACIWFVWEKLIRWEKLQELSWRWILRQRLKSRLLLKCLPIRWHLLCFREIVYGWILLPLHPNSYRIPI